MLAWAAGLAGLLLLQKPWSGRSGRAGAAAAVGGWMLIGVAVALWCRVAGWTIGIAYAAVSLAPTAWTLIILAARSQRSAAAPRRPARSPQPAGGKAMPFWLLPLRVAAALPLAGVAVMGAALLLLDRFGAVTGSGLTLVLLAAAPVWALVAVWAVADRVAWRPASLLLLLAAGTMAALLGDGV